MKTATPKEIVYPESDGKPMAETDLHRDYMVAIIQRLQARYRGKRVYVSGNLLIYYVEGDPNKSVAPDVFVVKNCSPRKRRTFKIWEEKRVPSWVMETTSRKTRREDRGFKKELYARLRVKECFLYDPYEEWLHPPLQGFRLENGDYVPITAEADGSLVSRELGVRLKVEDGELLMFDAISGEVILSGDERAHQAEQRADASLARARRAEKRAESLEEELRQLRRQIGRGGKNGGPRPPT